MAGRPDDTEQTLANLFGQLAQASNRAMTLDELKTVNNVVKAIQANANLKVASDESRRKDAIGVGKYLGGLVFLAVIFVAFLAYTPADKRFDMLKELIPVLTAALGFIFGAATAKKD